MQDINASLSTHSTVSWETWVIPYPSVNCIGVCRHTAGSILFSRSLLNSKASSTRNGFNNMSSLPHKTTQAQWEAKRFTSLRPSGPEPLWDDRRLSLCLRAARLNGRGLETFAGALFLAGWEEKSLSRICWLESGALRFRPWGLLPEESAPDGSLLPSLSWVSPSSARLLWRV